MKFVNKLIRGGQCNGKSCPIVTQIPIGNSGNMDPTLVKNAKKPSTERVNLDLLRPYFMTSKHINA